MEQLVQDLQYAGRQLWRNPAFSLTAVLTLALGIGANTAIFSVADVVLLRPLPYPNSGRLVMVWNKLSKIGVRSMPLSAEDFDAFSAGRAIFQTTAAFSEQDRNLIVSGNSERVAAISSTPGLLELLGAKMAAGRRFTKDDWNAGHTQVAVLSYALYVRRFAAHPSIIGHPVRLDGAVYNVAGVLAKDFEFSLSAAGVDVWTPLAPAGDRRAARFRMLALMRPGVGIEAAQSAVSAIAKHLNETVHPYAGPNGEDAGYGASVVSLHDQMLHDFRTGTLILLGAAGLVLMIACVNVANLLLIRTAAREKEIAVRRALGASGGRLIRQWLTEAGLLTILGGTAGLVTSFAGLRGLKAMSPAEVPGVAALAIDGRAILFTIALSVITCCLFSLAPVFSIVQTAGKLRGARPRSYLSKALITAEAALALLLLVGSGLLLRSFAQLSTIDTGIQPGHLLTMQVELSGARYDKPRARVRYFSELQSRLARSPEVVSVSATDRIPVFTVGADTREGNPFSIDGSPFRPDASARQIAHTGTVGVDYFPTMGIPLLAGRSFTRGDTLDAEPVAVINKTLARVFFPKEDPVGRRILLGLPEPGARWLTIVGVIGDVRTGALDLPPMPQFYTPEAQAANSKMFLVLRTTGDPLLLAHAAITTVRQLDPEVAAGHIGSMQEHVNQTLAQPRFQTVLLSLFGGSALFLAAVGIYGVVAHSVIQRTKEIGIRMALGANGSDVAKAVLVDGLRPVAAGMVFGFAAAAVLTRFVSSVLYQIKPSDPGSLFGAAMLLAIAAILACVGPTRRALRVGPAVALKHE